VGLMSKPKKGPRKPKKGVIQSDPERVRRAEQEAEWAAEQRQADAEFYRSYYGSGVLGARRYRNSGGPMNTERPYQGGLPGLGKGN
jgi:hypothetical protein